MAVTNVQHPTTTSGTNWTFGSTNSVALGFNTGVTAGNFLVCAFIMTNQTPGTITVSGSVNGAYTQANLLQAQSVSQGIYYFAGSGSGSETVTVSATSSGGYLEFGLWEFHSSLGSTWFPGGHNGNSAATGTTLTTGNLTPNTAADGAVALGAGSNATGATSGWSSAATANGQLYEWVILASSSVINPAMTQTSSGPWTANGMTFSDTSGGGGGGQVNPSGSGSMLVTGITNPSFSPVTVTLTANFGITGRVNLATGQGQKTAEGPHAGVGFWGGGSPSYG